jgi:hypothetical protein
MHTPETAKSAPWHATVREAEALMQRRGVDLSQLINRAYVDLLAERSFC